jgi:hypothetical protein
MFTAGFMIKVWGYMNKSWANNKKISKFLIGCDWLTINKVK